MILHHNKERFEGAILATAAHFNIATIYVEKDYWVTYVLKKLSGSKYKDQAIFKGGTSLSKALKIIRRFSEDVDVAVVTRGMSGNQVKNLIRNIEQDITTGLTEEEVPGITSKGSKFRKTVYQYGRVIKGEDFGQANDKLLIEINAFANPYPFKAVKVQSLIAEYLVNNNMDLIKQLELESFEVNVLGLERTLAEKVLALVRASYNVDPIKELGNKIRHVYDIHMILQSEEFKKYIFLEDFFKRIEETQKDDASNNEFKGEWNELPLSKALLFAELAATWKKLEHVYNGDFKKLVYGKLPKASEIKNTLEVVGLAVKKFDEWAKK